MNRAYLRSALVVGGLAVAPFPGLYPLVVAAAAVCRRFASGREARIDALFLVLGLSGGVGILLPLQVLELRSLWPLGLVTAMSVWLAVDDFRWLPFLRTQSSEASAAGIEIGGTQSAGDGSSGRFFSWDRPTRGLTKPESPGPLPLGYDFDADRLIGPWAARTALETFVSNLFAACLSSVNERDLDDLPRNSTRELVDAMTARGMLTPYQAVLLCAELPHMLHVNDFEVLERIGRGGMAIVLRVRHRFTGHQYALKLLENVDRVDSIMKMRFLREMDAVCELAHPCIAVARSVGQEGNRMHIAMELVEGRNVAEIVAEEGPLPVSRALDLIGQAARALAHAHARGLVHRDVKPGNLMVGTADRVKLVDMGLARFMDAIDSEVHPRDWRTGNGRLIGTIDYMSPEQADELAVSDHRSDIYSLGCTLFFMLTGQSHLRGRTQRRRALSLVNRRGMTRMRNVRQDLPECIYRLVTKMTRLDPAERFQSMTEVISAIDGCAEQFGLTSPSECRLRVLMVEDSATQLMVTRHKLEETSPDVDVTTAASLNDAIEAVAGGRFDIILLDLNLPDSEGVETVTRLRQVDTETPVLVMTGSSDPQLGVRCIETGADDFLPKAEIDPGKLERHILLTIGRRQLAIESQ